MKQMVKDAGLEGRVEVDSAGTAAYHERELPDSRMALCASMRGYRLHSYSRPVRTKDFYDFDLIVAMDDQNVDSLKRKAPDLESLQKIRKMTDFSTDPTHDHVPDPYYGGASGFELVMDLLEDACRNLLQAISATPDS